MTISSIGSGGGRTYSTLQAWENACPANLVSSADTWEGECYNDSEFAIAGTVLVIAGITTDATHNVQLRCATGQSFRDNAGVRTNALTYNASNGVGIRTTGAYNNAVTCSVNYSTFDGLQIKSGTGSGNVGLTNTGTNNTVTDCIVFGTSAALSNGGSGTTYKTYNCLAINGLSGQGVFTSGTGCEVVGCTIVCPAATGSTGVVTGNYVTALIQNCAVFGFTNFQTGTGGATSGSGANCTDKATAFGSTYGNQVSKTFANQFTSTTTDFSIKAGADCINNGVYNSLVDPDISATARSGSTPTIGCWEYVSAGGGGLPFFMQDDLMCGYLQSLSGGMQ